MNFFQRIASWFSKKRDQKEVVYSGPIPGPAPEPKVITVPVTNTTVHEIVPPLKPVDNPILRSGDYSIRLNTDGPFKGLYTVVETQQSFATLGEAQDYCQRLTDSMRGRTEGDAKRAEEYDNLQPGEIDVETVDADDFLFYAANYFILNKASPTGRLLGPWRKVSRAINWLQCQGGEPTAKLAAAFPTPNSQFMQHFKYQNEGANSYTGRFRAAYDQNK